METKQQNQFVRKAMRRCGFTEDWLVNPVGRSGGLALWWKDEVVVNILVSSQNIIHTSISASSFETPAYISFVYGPPDEHQRLLCWKEIKRLACNIHDSWLCVGDFNDIASLNEKCGGRPRAMRKILNFQNFISDCELLDLGFNGSGYTWCNNREGEETIRERIDRALGNTYLREAFPQLEVFHLDPLGSDHHLLLINCYFKKQSKKRLFKFEPYWTEHPNYSSTVQRGWRHSTVSDISPTDCFITCLNSCRKELVYWSSREFHNNRRLLDSLRLKLVECLQRPVSYQSKQEANRISSSIELALDREEQYWRQRSRISWLQAGDRNSRFFHLSTIKRRRCNSILSIKDDNGCWLTEQSDISANISSFFQNLFTSSGQRAMDEVLNYVEPKISAQANSQLMEPVSKEEIRSAAFSLGSTKAPGPDGFSGNFYQSSWSTIGDDVSSMVLEFFGGHSSAHRINETNLILIPKIEKPEHVSQFRPIGLCNFSYKIISKILANRMRPWLNECVSKNQSAFIPGRQIQDNIIIAHEVYHYLRRKKTGKKYEFALKMDMSKAYDRVEWDFLKLILLKLGFCMEWVKLIMNCVESVNLNLCLSGEKIGSITPERGLRQGDPLSPYLFILMAEALSMMINKCQDRGELKGIKLSLRCPILSHSFFADDALFFMNAGEQNCEKLSQLLNLYCIASGQEANLDKSSIFFSANTPELVRKNVCDILGINSVLDPGKYLGIPSIWGKTKHQALSYIRERVKTKMQGWSKSTLSYAGREVMIKSVINAIPIYSMNCFKFPVQTCKELNSLIANFWWDGHSDGNKTHWKNWNYMTEAKANGGMGFKDFLIMNDALLAKTAWRIFHNPNDLWVRVLKSIYFPTDVFVDAQKGPKASWCWSSILEGREFLKKDLIWDIGNGSSVRIWGDTWIPNNPLPIPNDENDNFLVKHGRVSDLIHHGAWDLSEIRHLLTEADIMAINAIPIPSNIVEDKLYWIGANNGDYTVKCGYFNAKKLSSLSNIKATTSISITATDWRKIWKLKTVPRIQQFIWRVLCGALATNDALFKRHRSATKYCPICEQEEETIEHLFFYCSWTRYIWFGCAFGLRIANHAPNNFVIWWLSITSGGEALAEHELSLICLILWNIWKQRNNLVFSMITPCPSIVIDLANAANNEFWAVSNKSRMQLTPEYNTEKIISWQFPPMGWLKINCDAAFNHDDSSAALGLVCRNDYGDFIWGFADKIKSLSAFMAEALALKRALLLAHDMGHDKVVFEVDCNFLLKSVEAKQPDLYDWQCRGVLQEIINLLATKVGYSLSFTPRQGNVTADHLAANAIKGVSPVGWVSEPSLSLKSFLTSDARKAQCASENAFDSESRVGVG